MFTKKLLTLTIQILSILILGLIIIFHLLTNVIDWYYPDYIAQIDFIKRSNLFGALYANWAHTSIGRPAGVLWIDLWIYLCELFNINNVYSLIFYRSFSFLIVGLSFTFLVKQLLKLSFIFSTYISLIFFLIFIIASGQTNFTMIWGMDLSLYVVSIIYLNFFIIFISKIKEGHSSKFNIFMLSTFNFLYLNSSYAHLAIGGLIIVIIFLDINKIINYVFSPNTFIKEVLFLKTSQESILINKILRLQLIIFIISAIINLLSPSINLREGIWPSDMSFIEGLLSSIPLLEYHLLSVWGYKYLYITFVIFIIIKYLNININLPNFFIIFIFLVSSLLLVLTNSLAYLSSTLHQGYGNIAYEVYLTKNLLILTDNNHASSSRHLVYYNINAIVSYIFLGIFLGKNIKINKKK